MILPLTNVTSPFYVTIFLRYQRFSCKIIAGYLCLPNQINQDFLLLPSLLHSPIYEARIVKAIAMKSPGEEKEILQWKPYQ